MPFFLYGSSNLLLWQISHMCIKTGIVPVASMETLWIYLTIFSCVVLLLQLNAFKICYWWKFNNSSLYIVGWYAPWCFVATKKTKLLTGQGAVAVFCTLSTVHWCCCLKEYIGGCCLRADLTKGRGHDAETTHIYIAAGWHDNSEIPQLHVSWLYIKKLIEEDQWKQKVYD
jgi:hypothetical protein